MRNGLFHKGKPDGVHDAPPTVFKRAGGAVGFALTAIALTSPIFFCGCSAPLPKTAQESPAASDVRATDAPPTPTPPETYRIAYEMTDEDSSRTVEKIKDRYGSIYYMESGHETLLVREGSRYRRYELEDGVWVTDAANPIASEAEALELTESIDSIMHRSALHDDASYSGSTSVAGRSCSTWSSETGVAIYEHTSTFSTDDATGICLAWAESGSIDTFELGEIENGTCVRFEDEFNEVLDTSWMPGRI